MSRRFVGRSRRSVLNVLLAAGLGVAGYFTQPYWSKFLPPAAPSSQAPDLKQPPNSTSSSSRTTSKSPAPAKPSSSAPVASKSPPAQPDAEVFVERVVDGDTLVLEGGDRVRLIGVDTPETHHPTKPVQPFGPEAAAFTKRLVEGKRVQLRFDPRETKDKYQRTLAYIYIDGEFLNERLLREGLARAMTQYPFSAEMKRIFIAAEAEAKSARRGVWSLPVTQAEAATPKRR